MVTVRNEQNPMPVFMGGTPMPRFDTTIPLLARAMGGTPMARCLLQ